MNNKKFKFFIIIFLFFITVISCIDATSLTNYAYEYTPYQGKTNSNVPVIDNGILFGRTIMTINSDPCGPLQFVNISIKGEVTKEIKSGVFGFFISRIPIGRYLVTASIFGFHSTYTCVNLFRFKPFVIITLKLEKKGWK
jgi:hypothetical protein